MGLVVGGLVGSAVGFYAFIRTTNRLMNRQSSSKNREVTDDHAPLTFALGGLAAGLTIRVAAGLEARTSALVGAFAASFVGGLVMIIKTRLSGGRA